jgi:membrane dipeptidase
MTLSHGCNTPWIDTANVELRTNDDLVPEANGITEFGVKVVKEMNRLGMIVDLSHVSTDAMRQVLRITEAPVIFSHSGARAVTDHPRNIPGRLFSNKLEKL